MNSQIQSKDTRSLFRQFAVVLLLALACAGAKAAEDPIVFRFNDASTKDNWVKFWGAAYQTNEFDATRDVGGNAASGSLKVTANFNLATFGGDNQFALRGALGGNNDINSKVVDATLYDRLEFDLYWDPASPTRPVGDHGWFEVGLVPVDYSQVMFPGFSVPVVDGWQHFSLPISGVDQTKISQIGALIFKMWAGNEDNALTGTATFWLDNIKLLPKGYITGFDNDGYIANNAFWSWWGTETKTVEWDATTDAGSDTNSGAIKISVDFTGGGDYSYGMSLSGTNNYNGAVTIRPANFTAMEFDLLWDTASTLSVDTLNTSGDPQGLGIGFAKPDWGQNWAPNASQPRPVADGQWQHISVPLNPSWEDIPGLIFKKWFPSGETEATGTMQFWIDNIRFIPTTEELPPPTMAVQSAAKGLNLTLSGTGQYQRQGIRANGADALLWVGNPQPVTYSMTIADFPSGATYPGMQAHMFLTPDSSANNGPDYSDPTSIMLDIKATAAGAATAVFRYKTNSPNNNSMMYRDNPAGGVVGVLGTLNAPSIIGTWSLTFSNDTNITITGPGNSTVSFVMPPEHATSFAGSSMGTIFGIQPNQLANLGQTAVISEIKVTSGTDVIVDDKFETSLPTDIIDPNIWTRKLDSPIGLAVVDTSPSMWLRWSLPDADFVLRAKTNLNTASFDAPVTPIISGSSKQVLITPTTLPDEPAEGYFFLVKPAPPAP